MAALLANHTLPEDDWNGFKGVIGRVFLRDLDGILISLPAVGLITRQEITAVERKAGREKKALKKRGFGGGVVSVVCSPLGPSALLRCEIIARKMKDVKNADGKKL